MPRFRHRLTKRQRRFLEERYFIFREPTDDRPRGRRPGWLAMTRSGAHARYWRQYRYELEQDLLSIHYKELRGSHNGRCNMC